MNKQWYEGLNTDLWANNINNSVSNQTDIVSELVLNLLSDWVNKPWIDFIKDVIELLEYKWLDAVFSITDEWWEYMYEISTEQFPNKIIWILNNNWEIEVLFHNSNSTQKEIKQELNIVSKLDDLDRLTTWLSNPGILSETNSNIIFKNKYKLPKLWNITIVSYRNFNSISFYLSVSNKYQIEANLYHSSKWLFLNWSIHDWFKKQLDSLNYSLYWDDLDSIGEQIVYLISKDIQKMVLEKKVNLVIKFLKSCWMDPICHFDQNWDNVDATIFNSKNPKRRVVYFLDELEIESQFIDVTIDSVDIDNMVAKLPNTEDKAIVEWLTN